MLNRPRNMRRRMRLRLLLAGAVLPLALWAVAAGVLRGRVVAEQPPARPAAQDPDDAGQDRPAQGHRAPADHADQRLLPAHRTAAEPHRHASRASSPTRRPISTPSATSCSASSATCAPSAAGWCACAPAWPRLAWRSPQRLVELYQADKPDIVTVIMSSKGFAELLERGEFMQRVSEQDQRIIKLVARRQGRRDGHRGAPGQARDPPAARHRDRPAAPRRDRPRQAGPHRHQGRARRHPRRQGARARHRARRAPAAGGQPLRAQGRAGQDPGHAAAGRRAACRPGRSSTATAA